LRRASTMSCLSKGNFDQRELGNKRLKSQRGMGAGDWLWAGSSNAPIRGFCDLMLSFNDNWSYKRIPCKNLDIMIILMKYLSNIQEFAGAVPKKLRCRMKFQFRHVVILEKQRGAICFHA